MVFVVMARGNRGGVDGLNDSVDGRGGCCGSGCGSPSQKNNILLKGFHWTDLGDISTLKLLFCQTEV